MIEAKDLRIGNYVLYLDELYIVDGIKYESNSPSEKYRISLKTIDSSFYGAKMDNWVNPIPLTPEILEKCGYNVVNDNTKEKPQYSGDVLVKMIGFEFSNSMNDGFYCWELNGGRTVFKYLHQLQNLYYALTGEELKIEI